MVRFFVLSLVIHLALYFVVTSRQPEVIEDPIVSVTLQEGPDQPSSPPRRPSPPKVLAPATSSAAKNMKETSADTSRPQDNSSPDTGNSETSAQSSGNVSVKPRVLRSFKAEYPDSAKQARVEGAVRLSVLIDPTGHVQEAIVLEGPGYGLNETAQDAIRKFVFSPAEKDGEKVAVRIVYVYRFRLESR